MSAWAPTLSLRTFVYGCSLVCVALPDFTPATGYLPPGRHPAHWLEVVERFATNAYRRELTAKLMIALQMLRAAGCRQVWINGSYATDSPDPGDVDVAFDAWGVQPGDKWYVKPEDRVRIW